MLPIIDRMWVDHLYVMDALKTGIGLRGYGQKDPRVEYEKEAFEIFEDLKNNIADEAIKAVYAVKIERQEEPPPAEMQPAAQPQVPAHPGFEPLPSGAIAPQPAAPNGNVATAPMPQRTLDDETAAKLLGPVPAKPRSQVHTNRGDEQPAKPAARAGDKVGRNDLCPCGSGKKYKRCHGTAA
jgi:preprotein translocase subunit SecA